MKDKALVKELCIASELEVKDLHEFFMFLSQDVRCLLQQRRGSSISRCGSRSKSRRLGTIFGRSEKLMYGQTSENAIDYELFAEALHEEGCVATKRSILQVVGHLRNLQDKLNAVHETVEDLK